MADVRMEESDRCFDNECGIEIDDGPMIEKFWKVWPDACEPCLPCNTCCHPLRKAVSRSKRRYEADGFSLDLAYLTPNIITMGFPATGIEHLYRNPRFELVRFLETRHRDHYKVYNLCSEPGRGYKASIFDGRVERYPFTDHMVPPPSYMVRFAESAVRWLDQDPNNVVAIHCKAGKGRAGVFTCVLLCRLGFKPTVGEVLKHYDETRVTNHKGLTVPSQIRYVNYYDQMLRNGSTVPPERELGIVKVELLNGDGKFPRKLSLKVYTAVVHGAVLRTDAGVSTDGVWDVNVSVKGNVYLKLFKTGLRKKKFTGLWFNTGFEPYGADTEHTFVKADLDKIGKDRAHRKYPPDVALRVTFELPEGGVAVVDTTASSSRAAGGGGRGRKSKAIRGSVRNPVSTGSAQEAHDAL